MGQCNEGSGHPGPGGATGPAGQDANRELIEEIVRRELAAHRRSAQRLAEAAGPPRPVPTDPRQDSRPEADSLFNPAFVDVPPDVKRRARDNRLEVSTGDVKSAWRQIDWRQMPIFPLNGGTAILCQEMDFMQALPHLGTARVAYHAKENWVCREYGFVFAAIVAAELQCNAGIVCDDEGHHLYSFVPVIAHRNDVAVKILIVEPQGDTVVEHTDPDAHYVGRAGFALLI